MAEEKKKILTLVLLVFYVSVKIYKICQEMCPNRSLFTNLYGEGRQQSWKKQQELRVQKLGQGIILTTVYRFSLSYLCSGLYLHCFGYA